MSGNKYTVVLPIAYGPYGEDCLATCKLDNILVVDNTVNNIGVMKSHNLGVDKMLEDGSDWLIILSAAIRFGEPGGMDFTDQLATADELVVEAAQVFGWHLIAFRREVIETVGRWDENFSPYGFDDLDYSWRFQKSYQFNPDIPLWTKKYLDCTDMGMAHSIQLAGVWGDPIPLMQYYRRKWGGLTGEERYDHPFNDPTKPISYWPDEDSPLSVKIHKENQ